MKRALIFALGLTLGILAKAQTDVTKKYIENPDFGARFAAWVNPGSFTFSTNTTSFEKKSGEVWMEKWVTKTSTLGNNSGMYQTLRNLPTGTYTLVAAAKNVSQNSPSKTCTGAYIYAGQEQVAFNEPGDYSVVFTVVNGKADIGVRLKACNGNWVCVDNFRLYYNGENADSIAAEQARLDKELADLKEKVAKATPTSLKVTTYDFVPTGNTIALGRSTVSGSSKEKGFCWSTHPEPTIFDETTTETFDNNGLIYVMRGLKPSTIYYVRAYAMTSGGYVAYGNIKKIATLPAGTMTYGFFNDNNGDEETCARINSASAECVWMYNNLSNIPGFYLSVHYVPGSGAGGGTADCSYGGWMRVSQTQSYQQTGTMLHETNHGVGVGTTNEWYNNSNLRSETTRGTWLGPRATRMVRFFENSTTAVMNGDGTHMWPYGINGAHEDSYNPSKQVLYYANILITHAMHQDGLICTSRVGFASPAYVFEQDDNEKYYIKCENDDCGGSAYLGMTSNGTLRSYDMSAEEALLDDNYAWQITYNPTTCYYTFRNVGTGKYLSNSGTAFKGGSSKTEIHLMPSRTDIVRAGFRSTSYWLIASTDHKALEGTTYSSTTKSYGTKAAAFNAANAATAQRWLLVTGQQLTDLESEALKNEVKSIKDLTANFESIIATPHVSNVEGKDVTEIDEKASTIVNSINEQAPLYTSLTQAKEGYEQALDALLTFLSHAKPASEEQPFDLSCFIMNPGFDNASTGWSTEATVGNSCAEFYQKNYDISQTLQFKFPQGTYEVRANAFQRPGTLDDLYYDYVEGGKDKVNAMLYIKAKTVKIKNIMEGAQSQNLKTGSTSLTVNGAKAYFPNDMASAQAWFKAGYYDNSVRFTTSSEGSLKFGLKSSANSAGGFWTCFDNFRLYYHGGDMVTAIDQLREEKSNNSAIYDLQGRRLSVKPQKGIYIQNGKKTIY